MYRALPENVQTRTGTTRGTKFDNIKYLAKISHHYDVAYYATCLEQGCIEDYTSERGRRLTERVIDQRARDKK